MPRRPSTPLLASLVAVACLGAGGGAVAYATLSSGNTVVKQVTVHQSEPVASTASNLSVNAIYRRAYRGVVEITVRTGSGSAEGSGFVYDSDGHIVTNDHVVNSAQTISVQFWNGKTYDATLVGSDSSTDLAVIKVDAPSSQLYPVSLGRSADLQVGDSVVAIGSPFGLQETVTSGIVSALHRSIDSLNQNFRIIDAIQTDAAINHGNSGGPLLDANGSVIGVNAQIRSDSGGSDGIGFAIPSDTVRTIAGQLISTGQAKHAYLGIALSNSATQARVAQVNPGTPAASAGLKAGDVITEVGGTNVDSADALSQAIDSHQPGETVTLHVTRGGKSLTVQVKLASRPS
jgi:putative serine protease PepD